jgi:predicted flap endonuclease-1-like 5' DNA nuclease
MDTRMQDQANISSEFPAVTDVPAGTSNMSAEELQKELAKWQARVPKLAGALKERTQEVETLRARLDSTEPLSVGGGEQSSGIQARDALIEELEAKVKALGGKHQDVEGQLRARDLEIKGLRQEASEWRDKWQSATTSLDEQSDSAGHKDREIKRLKTEIDELLPLQEQRNGSLKDQDLELTSLREKCRSLETRNEKLFETTELANRQIETLGDNLQHLRDDLKARNEEIAGREAEAGGAAKEVEELKRQLGARDQDIEFLHGHVEEKQQEISSLTERVAELQALEADGAESLREQDRLRKLLTEAEEEVSTLTDAVAGVDALKKEMAELQDLFGAKEREVSAREEDIRRRDAELEENRTTLETERGETRRLEECVAQADEVSGRWEAERRELSEQMDELRKRNQHLEAQLTERSDLVVGLEQEKSAINDKTSSLELENTRLSEALEKSQRHSADNADHIAQVDARLERQKQLMENLEEEFAQVQEEYADAVKAHQHAMNEKSAELAAVAERLDEDSVEVLKEQLGELENTLAEVRAELAAAEKTSKERADRLEDLGRELDQKQTQDDSAKEMLSEKVEKLEKQLRKQSKATSEAEEAAATVRARFEALEAEAARVPDEVRGENEVLQAEVLKLEGMVRERTEQLNKLRWQQDMIEKQASDGSDGKMLLVLNQQLAGARKDNDRLRERVRELEARPEAAEAMDDLASIRGIGPKLVKQLAGLGITRFDQIATLSESDLDDEKHPLHSMKGRILKDGWIGQAAKLGS